MINLLKNMSLLIVFGVAPTVALDYFSGSGFLDKFMADQSLSMLGTILAIYIAAASSFIAILNSYEDQEGKDIFSGTVKELKQTIAFIFIIFFAHFLLLVGTPTEASFACDLTLKSLKTFTFIPGVPKGRGHDNIIWFLFLCCLVCQCFSDCDQAR